MRLGVTKLIALILGTTGLVVAGVVLSLTSGRATAMPIESAAVSKTPTVGALFVRTASGQLTKHFCTASVVDSPTGNLVITAAHCLGGRSPSEIAFVPDYSTGHRPFGVWQVTKIIEDQQWMSATDPDNDFAFLVVHQPGSKVPVQALTGGEVLGIGETGGTVRVAGYPDTLDELISCQNAALNFSPTQFQFDCDGFTNGTSGSPLLLKTSPFANVYTVIGVIGGYQQGGDTAAVSYAAKFSSSMADLYQIALADAGE